MTSIYFSQEKMQQIWKNFIEHFKNPETASSYQSDLIEIMEIFQKNFLELTSHDVKEYFQMQMDKVEGKALQPSTVSKKIRELNSFASFIDENKEMLGISKDYENYFEPYLKKVCKMSKYANCIPLEHIDRLFHVAQEDIMAYCILTMIYRMGLSTTQIIKLRISDFSEYENGVYLRLDGRMEDSFVPEDVYKILQSYLSQREKGEYLFYNSRGNQLNTMYISRMMKKYTKLAEIPNYSGEALRNSCVYTMFSYHGKPEQIAREMGVTDSQIQRYHNKNYMDVSSRKIKNMVKVKVELPE